MHLISLLKIRIKRQLKINRDKNDGTGIDWQVARMCNIMVVRPIKTLIRIGILLLRGVPGRMDSGIKGQKPSSG